MKANLEELKNIKANLKTTLKSYLVKINQFPEERIFIENLEIPIDNGIDEWTPPLPPTVYTDKFLEYNNRIDEHNKNNDEYKKQFIESTGENPWAHPRHGNVGEMQRGNSKITRTSKKEILGKERCIYKKSGDRKQYLKYKGGLITITEYKKIMAAKNKK